MTIHAMPTLGQTLAKAREDAGLLQREVADALRLKTPQPVSNWERDVNVPEGPHIAQMIRLYGMDEDATLLAWARAKTATPAESSPGPAQAGHPLDEMVPRPSRRRKAL